MTQIHPVADPQSIEECRALIREYATWLNLDRCFGSLEAELAGLPGEYAPPMGILLLARREQQAAGCVSLRRIAPGVCEMKRLFVRPAFRELGIGVALVQSAIAHARAAGYDAIRLDTIKSRMPEAVALYRSLGFVDIPPYNDHPADHTGWMELVLQPGPVSSGRGS